MSGDPHAYTPVQFCALRAGRLAPSGVPVEGADNLYVTGDTVEGTITPVIAEGETQEQRNGCGNICATLAQPDRLTRVDVGLSLCTLDSELIELLCGGTLVTNGAGVTIGYELPGPTDDVGANGVYVELWAKAWEGDSQAGNVEVGSPLYFHFVLPRVKFTLGAIPLGAAFATIPVNGKGGSNPAGGNGPANDLPHDFTKPGGWFLDDTLPVPAVGYQATPAQS